MLANIVNKFIALILAFLMSIGIITPTPIPPGGIEASVELNFANDEKASAAGTLTVTSNYDAAEKNSQHIQRAAKQFLTPSLQR